MNDEVGFKKKKGSGYVSWRPASERYQLTFWDGVSKLLSVVRIVATNRNDLQGWSAPLDDRCWTVNSPCDPYGGSLTCFLVLLLYQSLVRGRVSQVETRELAEIYNVVGRAIADGLLACLRSSERLETEPKRSDPTEAEAAHSLRRHVLG